MGQERLIQVANTVYTIHECKTSINSYKTLIVNKILELSKLT